MKKNVKMVRKSIDVSHLMALSSSDSEDEAEAPQSSLEKISVKDKTPGQDKKKKAKKVKTVDLSVLEVPASPAPRQFEKNIDEEVPGPEIPGSRTTGSKKKKKHKEDKSNKRRKSQSDVEEVLAEKIISPKSKLIAADLEMQFTSSDVGSQESPTKKHVQNIIDSLDSSALDGSPVKSVKTLRSPKKSEKTVHIEDSESEIELDEIEIVHTSHKKSKKQKRKRKQSLSEESIISGIEELSQKNSLNSKSDVENVGHKTPEKSDVGSRVDGMSESDDSSDVPEPTVFTQRDPVSSSDSEMEDDSAGPEAADATKLLRHKPENFTEVSSFKAPWLEDLQKGAKELWLVKVPAGCDTSFLDGKKLTWGQKKIVKTEVNENENENFPTVWELTSNRISDKQGVNLTALVPSKKDKVFHSAGQIAGQITLTKGVKVPEYIMPQTGLKSPPRIPQGLKRRHQPFGADDPMETSNYDVTPSKSAKKKKKEKKHKRSLDTVSDKRVTKKKAKKEKAEKH